MSFGFFHFMLSAIFTGLGYYIKARFEINQEKLIWELQRKLEKMKVDHDKKYQKLDHQLWQTEQARDHFKRDLQELQAQVKAGRFDEIAKIANIKSPTTKALQSFL